MVDVQLTNEKLVERAKRIVMDATECDAETAERVLKQADQKPKIAIVMILAGLTMEEAVQRLEESQGFVRQAIQ